MRSQERASARRQLDKRLNILRDADALAPPPRGWIKAIREALGMTTAQLAKRLGVSQPRVVAIEKAEITGAITLETLGRVAQALDCRLICCLAPKMPLTELAASRAAMLARQRMQSTRHSMALEAQSVDAADEREQLRALARSLLEQPGSALWADE